MTIKCVVACYDDKGGPAFYDCLVSCTELQYNHGEHYACAMEAAAEAGYAEPMVIFDENDGPPWLFTRFDQDRLDELELT